MKKDLKDLYERLEKAEGKDLYDEVVNSGDFCEFCGSGEKGDLGFVIGYKDEEEDEEKFCEIYFFFNELIEFAKELGIKKDFIEVEDFDELEDEEKEEVKEELGDFYSRYEQEADTYFMNKYKKKILDFVKELIEERK